MADQRSHKSRWAAAHAEPGHPVTPQARGGLDAPFDFGAPRDQRQSDLRQELENILPEINALAQKVGGMKRLAELANALAETTE